MSDRIPEMDNIGATMKGMYRDILLNADQQVIYDSGWVANTIVERGRVLLAAFMKGDVRAVGIQYMEVGQGVDTWGTKPPAVDPRDVGLTSPYFYHFNFGPADIVYIDDKDTPSMTPTRHLKIQATFEPGKPADPPCPLREFALFGKFGDDYYMINSVRHSLIQKAATDTLVRTVQLYF